MSKTIFICYAAPSRLQRTAVSASATKINPKTFSSVSVSAMKCIINSKIIFLRLNCHLSENSRRLWLFPGSVQEFCRKVPGKLGKIAGKFFPNREMLQILGFRAPGKANLPETLGPHCRDLVPTFRAGCLLRSTVPAFSSFSEFGRPVDSASSKPPPLSFPHPFPLTTPEKTLEIDCSELTWAQSPRTPHRQGN